MMEDKSYSTETRTSLEQALILVVEDELILAEDIRDNLISLGYRVLEAVVSGEDAVRRAEEMRPDLVLMDIKLQGEVDGIQAAEQIQILDIPVIFITAFSDNVTLQRSKIAAPFGYIIKPVETRELHVAVEIALYRHQLEAKSKESERWLDTTLRSIGDGVIATDAVGRVTFMNPVAEELTGWKQADAVGCDLTEVFHIVNEVTREPVANPVARVLREGAIAGLANHTLLIHKDGSEIPIDDNGAPIRDENGIITGVVLVFRDITERKRIEEQLHQHERLAAVGQLAAGIAHDFRNMLTTIILYTNMGLRKPGLPPNLAQNLETILGESKKAADLVQQILDFSSRAMIQAQPLDLQTFVEETVDILRRTIPENIRLVLETGSKARSASLVVEADPTRIQQAVMNLATNARDAMSNGGELRFELSRIEFEQGDELPVIDMPPGEWICLVVSDTGVGMSEDVRAHLFEPFFTTKEVGKGTGLGLAQVYGIIRQHEGYVGVETAVGKGTTFRIYLPPATDAQAEIVAEKVSAGPRAREETILLVEDNERLQEAGREILESLGYRVLVAANGREALEVYQTKSGVDLVVTDMVMPEMGGKELVQELRRMTPNLKAIGVTGYAADEVAVGLSEEGFLDVMNKPYDVDTLTRVIRRVLDVGGC